MISVKYKIIFLLILFFNFNNSLSYENKIIVKVDNKVITNYDLKSKILTSLVIASQEITQENIDKTKPLALKSLIELKIKENELKNYKIKTTEMELINNLNILSNNNINEFKEKFFDNNLDYEKYKKDLAVELSWRKLIYFLYNKKVEISDSEISLQLDNLIKNDKSNLEFRLIELLVAFSDANDKEKKISKLNGEIKAIGFEEVLKKYNESPTKNNLGDLGWINSKSLSPKILEAIKDLNINQISEPIVLGNEIMYLKLKDKKVSKIKEKDIEDLKKKILKSKENQRFNLYSNSHLSKLKNLTTIEYQ